MTLPRTHLDSLERHVRVHEERLTLLRAQRNNILEDEIRQQKAPAKGHGKETRQKVPATPVDPNLHLKIRTPEWTTRQRELLDREIRIHEQLIELAQNPRVLEALGELAKNREFAREAARDPKGAARKWGIDLPPNMTLLFELEQDRVQLRISYYDDLCPFMVTWNSDSGFSPPPDPSFVQKAT